MVFVAIVKQPTTGGSPMRSEERVAAIVARHLLNLERMPEYRFVKRKRRLTSLTGSGTRARGDHPAYTKYQPHATLGQVYTFSMPSRRTRGA